jgi:quinol monooxygenase YgiN
MTDVRQLGVLYRRVAMAVIAVADMFGIGGRRSELVALLERSERQAVGDPGCRRYTFAAALGDPDRFVLVSEWDSQEALDAHHRSEAFDRFQFGLEGLLARPSEMTVYSISESVRPQNTRPMDPRDAD